MVNAGAYPPPPPMPPPGGYGATPPPPPGSNKSKIGLILGIVAGVLLLGCLLCGGGVYFFFSLGRGEIEKQVRVQVENHPKVVEFIGPISKFDWEFMKTVETQQELQKSGRGGVNVYVFTVTGSKGSGSIKAYVTTGPGGLVPLETTLETGGKCHVLVGEGAEEEEGGIEFAPSEEMVPDH